MIRKRWLQKGILLGVLVCTEFMCMPSSVMAEPGYEKVASGTSGSESVAQYGMTPITGDSIKDGTYTVDVACSSSFFKVLDAQLTVKEGKMTAVLNMSSNSYLYVFPGTGEAAASASMEEYIPLEKGDAKSSFTIPVAALNADLDLAAFSKKKEQWYDRKILIRASSLPAEAMTFALPDYDVIADAIILYDQTNGTTTVGEEEAEEKEQEETNVEAVKIDRKDGTYSIEADLTGGSGRASITSPTWLYVKDGRAYAKLLWSSSYYDYMIVGGKKYLNETTDGSNSTFTIPIIKMDEPVTVIGDTTAMGDSLEITYTLNFYSDTVGGIGRIPQEAAKKVLVIALMIIIGGGILNYFVKKKRYR